MAVTLAGPDQDLVYFAWGIEKSEELPDGDVKVFGKCTDGSLDRDLQRVDVEWSKAALSDWLRTGGNVRLQHDAKRPVGKGIDLDFSPDGHYLTAVIVDEAAKALVRKGVLTSFSIGVTHPQIDPDPSGKAVNGIIRGRSDGLTEIAEVSVVDRPSNRSTGFTLVRAAADGSPEFVGKVWGADDPTVKAALEDGSVTLELPADVSVAFSPADLAKLVAHKRQAQERELALTKAAAPDVAKRDFDPNVGGGVDRDKLPASDFAGRDRSFPIVKPGDVSDALQSIGRAGPGNYPPEKLRRNILRIARRKGFPVPEADRKARKADKGADSEVTRDVAAAEQATSRAQAAQDTDPDRKSDPADRKVSRDLKRSRRALEATAREQAKDNAGDAKQHAKAKKAKAKKAAKAAGPQVVKKKKVTCQSCGAMQNRKHAMCSECGASLAAAPDVTKNHDFACLNCGHKPLDKGEKFCPECGAENKGYTPLADRKLPMNASKAGKPKTVKRAKRKKKKAKAGEPFGGKEAPPFGEDGDDKAAAKAGKGRVVKKRKRSSGKPEGITPGEAGHVPGQHEKPAGPHREPDGAPVEAFEDDARMQDGDHEGATHLERLVGADKSADPEVAAALHLRTLGVPQHLGALHALSCPAYKPKDVAKAFPHASFGTIELSEWQAGSLTKAASAPLAEARRALDIWHAASTLKSADPEMVAHLRRAAHKRFRDANPGPSHAPTPAQISPEHFNRPLITAGHEAPSPGHGAPHHVRVPHEGGVDAEDYTRGYLAEGRAADSPANTHPQAPMPAPRSGSPTQGPVRHYYTNAARDGARHALQIMHDHIAINHPDICPMHGAEDIARHPVPVPEGVPRNAPAPGRKKGKKANKAARKTAKAKIRKHSAKRHTRNRALKSARTRVMAETPAPVPVDAAAIEAAISKATQPLLDKVASQEKALRKQRKMLDAISGQPDTSHAPRRGVALTKSSSAPAGPMNPSALAEQAQMTRLQLLHNEFLSTRNSADREAAYREYTAALGIAPSMQT